MFDEGAENIHPYGREGAHLDGSVQGFIAGNRELTSSLQRITPEKLASSEGGHNSTLELPDADHSSRARKQLRLMFGAVWESGAVLPLLEATEGNTGALYYAFEALVANTTSGYAIPYKDFKDEMVDFVLDLKELPGALAALDNIGNVDSTRVNKYFEEQKNGEQKPYVFTNDNGHTFSLSKRQYFHASQTQESWVAEELGEKTVRDALRRANAYGQSRHWGAFEKRIENIIETLPVFFYEKTIERLGMDYISSHPRCGINARTAGCREVLKIMDSISDCYGSSWQKDIVTAGMRTKLDKLVSELDSHYESHEALEPCYVPPLGHKSKQIGPLKESISPKRILHYMLNPGDSNNRGTVTYDGLFCHAYSALTKEERIGLKIDAECKEWMGKAKPIAEHIWDSLGKDRSEIYHG